MSIFDFDEPAGTLVPQDNDGWLRLDIAMERQRGDNWCWAAVTKAVGDFLNVVRTQCEIANAVKRQSDCCDEPNPCDTTERLECALAQVATVRHHNGPATVDSVVRALEGSRPVGACIEWRGGGFHFVLITGIRTGDMPVVEVMDPARTMGDEPVPHSLNVFMSRYPGDGKWCHHYLID